MMTKLEKEHTAAVIEMGVSEPDEMDNLSRIAKPDFFVMTNIGVSHIGQFGSKENILKEKANIVNGFEIENSKSFAYDLKDINCLFINGDDEQLRKIADYKVYLNELEANEDGKEKRVLNKKEIKITKSATTTPKEYVLNYVKLHFKFKTNNGFWSNR